MKKTILMMCAIPVVMAACTAYDFDNVNANEETRKFTFTVKGDFVNPEFNGIGDTRANSYMTADGVEMTDMWVVDVKEGNIVNWLHQEKEDENFGKPTMQLSLGTHHVMFLASRGTEPTFSNGRVTWTKPLDTFYKDYEVTVTKTSNGNRAVTLDRVATRLQIIVDDELPAGTTSIVLWPTDWYNGWDMMTGSPIAATEYNAAYNVSSYVGVDGLSIYMWGLSAQEEWTTNIELISKAGTTTNASVAIENAPFKQNRTTSYSGKLYGSPTEETNITLSAAWLPVYEGVY